ncbi:MAG: hypothetical protein ACFFD8_08060 [Candidatus Thorarchaeota archaeon]
MKKLRKLRVGLLVLVFSLTLVAVVPVQAKTPLIGTMDLQYNLAWPGPQDEIPDWVGKITIDGDGDGIGELYDMAFFAIGSGKAFVTPPFRGMIHFFEEIWVIGEINYEFNEDGILVVYEEVNILLWGYDKGTTNLQTSRYLMNGYVEEANGDFEGWAGRRVHMAGIIEWQILGPPENPIVAPLYAPGTFRIN